MHKIKKILRAVSEKTALPTNQPTNQLLPTTPILWTWLTPVQKTYLEKVKVYFYENENKKIFCYL